MTIISWGAYNSQFSARKPSRSSPTFRERTEDYKVKAWLILELCTNRIKITIKGRVKFQSCHKFSDLFGKESLLWPQYNCLYSQCL